MRFFEHVTARVDAICCCSFLLCARFPVTSVFSTCVSQREHTSAYALAQVDRKKKITRFDCSGAFRLIAEGPILSVAMSAEQTHQRLKESYENYRSICNECRQGIKRPTKHSQLSIKK